MIAIASALTGLRTIGRGSEFVGSMPDYEYKGEKKVTVHFVPAVHRLVVTSSPPRITLFDEAKIVATLVDEQGVPIKPGEPVRVSFGIAEGNGSLSADEAEIPGDGHSATVRFVPTTRGKIVIAAHASGLFESRSQLIAVLPILLLALSGLGGGLGGFLEAARAKKWWKKLWWRVLLGAAAGFMLYWIFVVGLGGSPKHAREFFGQSALFEENKDDATPYVHEEQFHNQLKARLLGASILTQVVRESTLAVGVDSESKRAEANWAERQSEIAWNLSTGVFYKVGGRPWKVAGIRDGVCYLGVVFKNGETSIQTRHACVAAQMFLDSGDGVIFKDAVGPWYSPKSGEFHLSRRAAAELVGMCIDAYRMKVGGEPRETLRFRGPRRIRIGPTTGMTSLDRAVTAMFLDGHTLGEGGPYLSGERGLAAAPSSRLTRARRSTPGRASPVPAGSRTSRCPLAVMHSSLHQCV